MSKPSKFSIIFTKDTLTRLYLEQGLSKCKIAKQYNTDHKRVSYYLKKHHIESRPVLEYELKRDFFKKQNHDMAYILGFILADGSITKDGKGVTFGVKESDGYLLQLIADKLGYNGKLKKWSKKDSKYSYITLSIFSTEIVQDLAKYGIVNGKTGKEVFPSLLDIRYHYAFLRGYLDGDGSVMYTPNKKRAVTWCCSNKVLLEDINKKILGGIGKITTSYSKTTKKPYYTLYMYKKVYISNLYNRLYRFDNGLCLLRKKIKMELAKA